VIRRIVFRRARWRCQACGRGGALEVHHIVKRALRGSDFDLDRLVALCAPCHAQTDVAYTRGRLVITPLGAGRFTAEVIRGADKGAIRGSAEPDQKTAGPTRMGRTPGGEFTVKPCIWRGARNSWSR
jgi:HNH endonuclease